MKIIAFTIFSSCDSLHRDQNSPCKVPWKHKIEKSHWYHLHRNKSSLANNASVTINNYDILKKKNDETKDGSTNNNYCICVWTVTADVSNNYWWQLVFISNWTKRVRNFYCRSCFLLISRRALPVNAIIIERIINNIILNNNWLLTSVYITTY